MEGNENKQRINFEYDEGLSNYFKDLKKYKPLKRDEERKLLIEYKEHNDMVARQKLITSNLRYACSLVNKYNGQGVPMSDLIEEANCGLIESIDKYDINQNVKIITYAKWNIEYKLQEAIRQKNKIKESDINETTESNNITCDVISDSECDEEKYDGVLNKPSIDDYDNNIVASTKLVEDVMGILNEKERDFLTMYYGVGDYNKEHTYQEIGNKYGITKERVRQVLEKVMRKLRVEILTIM